MEQSRWFAIGSNFAACIESSLNFLDFLLCSIFFPLLSLFMTRGTKKMDG